MTAPHHPAAILALAPLAWLYGAAVGWRNRTYDRSEPRERSPIPVISVGNLTVGGTGKTPLVAWLAHQLSAAGRRPAVVSRGYGGTSGRGPRFVSLGEGPLCSARESGDEPYLLARTLRQVIVVVGSDRRTATEAAARHGADVAVLDDGFQHRRLPRDLDIVLLDASNPFGNYRLLPAGLLREPVRALARADAVIITRSRPGESFSVIERVVRHHNRHAPLWRAGHRAVSFVDVAGGERQRPLRAVAFCGVGNPSRFRIDLEAEGIELVGFHAFRDHHVFRNTELAALEASARARGATLLTTEKDLVRLPSAFSVRAGLDLLSLRIEAVPFEPEPLLAAVHDAIERHHG